MSWHVSQNAEVAVVTRGQRHGGGRQSHDPASSPQGGCHKRSSLNHRKGGWKRKEGRRMKLKVDRKLRLCAEVGFCAS